MSLTVLLSRTAHAKGLKASQLIHQRLISCSHVKLNKVLGSALVHSYAQCGDYETAASVFEETVASLEVDVTSWNA